MDEWMASKVILIRIRILQGQKARKSLNSMQLLTPTLLKAYKFVLTLGPLRWLDTEKAEKVKI